MKKTVAEREAEWRSAPVKYHSNGSVECPCRVTYSQLLRECEKQHAEIARLKDALEERLQAH